MNGVLVHRTIPPMASTIRSPYFIQVNVGSIIERILKVFMRYGALPNNHIRLVGLYNPQNNQAVSVDGLPALDWDSLFKDRSYFVFSLDYGSESVTPDEFKVVQLDMYTSIWTGVVDGRNIRYLMIGWRDLSLQRANVLGTTSTYGAVAAFTENYRTRRLKYNRTLNRVYELYRGRTIEKMHQDLFSMTLYKCVEQVPFQLWIFVAEVWKKWPNVFSPSMLNDFSATYYTKYLTDAGQFATSITGLNPYVKRLIVQEDGASQSTDALSEFIAYSAYEATEEAVKDVVDFTYNDCVRGSTAAWPLLIGLTGDSFANRKKNLIDSA